MAEIIIRNMRIKDGRPNKNGRRVLASFNFEAGAFSVIGFLLIQDENRKFSVKCSYGSDRSGQPVAVNIVDPAMAEAVLARAVASYGFCKRRAKKEDQADD